MKSHKILILFILFFTLFVFSMPANAESEEPKPDAKAETPKSDDKTMSGNQQFYIHTLKEGDSIALLAKKYLGDGKLYEEILKANKGLDPKRMQVGDEIKIPILNNAKYLKSVSITKSDEISFAQMQAAKAYDAELEEKVRVYIAKLNHNVYAKIDEIKKILLDESNWNLESVKIPKPKNEEKKDEEVKDEDKKEDKSDPAMPDINMQSYHMDVIDGKDAQLNELRKEINRIRYTDVGVNIQNKPEKPDVDESAPEKSDKEKENEKMQDTGKRLSTSMSVNLNRKIDELQGMITNYHASLHAFLKFKYSDILKGLLIREKALPDNEKSKDENGLRSYVSKVLETKYFDEFEKTWNVNPLGANTEELNFLNSYTDLRNLSKLHGHGNLIHPSDTKFVESLENMIIINASLKKNAIKATFRGGWSEFGSGWIMLIFGIITLYGGLTLTFVLDFRSRRKGK